MSQSDVNLIAVLYFMCFEDRRAASLVMNSSVPRDTRATIYNGQKQARQ